MSEISVTTPTAAPVPDLVLWAPVVSAGAVVLVGFIAALIAWRQWRTAQTKLQLDLYEKRLPIFDATRTFLHRRLPDGPATPEQITDFLLATANARFLFDDEIADYIRKIADKSVQLMFYEANAKRGGGFNPQLPDYLTWVQGEARELERRFAPYMTVEARESRLLALSAEVAIDAAKSATARFFP